MSEQISNPLLSKLKMPGRIFQLPSRGLLYNNGELSPAIQNAELHVKPMSAYDEITMKNADLLFSGQALNSVFAACVPGIEKPIQLLGKDIDALMLYLRLVTYGPIYDIVANHYCSDESKAHVYSVNLESMLESIKYIDPTTIENNYTLHLDNGQIVIIRPITYAHVIEVLQDRSDKKNLTVEDSKKMLLTNLLSIIKSIDGIEDRELITQWIEAAPASYINTIADSVDKTNDWGLDLTVTLKCKDCGQEYPVEVPLNPISFFS